MTRPRTIVGALAERAKMMAERIFLYGALFWIAMCLLGMGLAVAGLLRLLPGQV